MSLPQRVCITLGILGLAFALPTLVSGQSTYVPQAGEYFIAGNLPGDQTYPQISLNQTGGFLVWQDNVTDGDGLGISAVQLDGSFSAEFGNFRVNSIGAGDQQNAQVALLAGGGAIFAWQGGVSGQQHIYARFLSSSNTWLAGDEMVNTATNFYQINPAVCVLTNGNVVVAWSSWNQDGSMQGVYAQLLSPTGQKIGGEIPVNQTTLYNQKSPAIAALAGGGFVIAWVSEQQRLSVSSATAGTSGLAAQYPNVSTAVSVDVYARLFNSSALASGNEFLVNTSTNLCANPSVAGANDGSFLIAWSQFDLSSPQYNSWDVYLRPFSSAGVGGNAGLANTTQYGDQYGPKVASLGTDFMVVWTSLGQDGSLQGVFGQFCYHDGSHNGGEFQVNTTTLNQQEYPAVASDGVGRFLAVWSSMTGPTYGMDLEAQRFANNLQALSAPDAPFILPLSSYQLQVTWPPLAGFNVSNYDLYINGSVTPTVVTSNYWVMSGLGANSTNCFSLDYVLANGQRSPQSAVSCGETWGNDTNYTGLPSNWEGLYWGPNPANWPPANKVLAPGGPTVLQAFLAGSNPLDPSTWLLAKTVVTPEGVLLDWNTVPGCIYQVLTATNLPPVWTEFGLPEFAAGTNDSVNLGVNSPGFYKISRLR